MGTAAGIDQPAHRCQGSAQIVSSGRGAASASRPARRMVEEMDGTGMNKIIDGKAFAEGLRGRIARQIAGLQAKHDLVPVLAVVLVREGPASQVYVRNKAAQT